MWQRAEKKESCVVERGEEGDEEEGKCNEEENDGGREGKGGTGRESRKEENEGRSRRGSVRFNQKWKVEENRCNLT